MRGHEITQALKERRNDNHCFVKWWRKENDFLDYDLIDRFMDNMHGEEISGIDLLTMDEMWGELRRVAGTRVKLVHEKKGDCIEWAHNGKEGEKVHVCAYTPETLMTIFDVETGGNPIDS